MKKLIKITVCFLISLCLAAGSASAEISTNIKAEITMSEKFTMPSFFADKMLFEQNKPMKLWGGAAAGSQITAELYRENGVSPAERVSCTANANGVWQLSFTGRAGGYDSYKIVILQNGSAVKTIENVVIGVLWLATGQSNMEYILSWAVGGLEAMSTAHDEYLRVLLLPSNPFGAAEKPTSPAADIPGSRWVCGDRGSDIASMSAMAYYASLILRSQLNVPVGIINAALGATNIQTWLSSESIDANETVKSSLEKNKLHFTAEQLAERKCNYNTMTAMYNTKIHPLSGMSISGVFWCQGETNVDGLPNNQGYFSAALQTLASCYSDTFGFENGDIPVIVANIAAHPYKYDAQCIPKWIEEVAAAARANKNIINIPIYDAPLTYADPPEASYAYSIHPHDKRIPGRRLGLAAVHDVYNLGGSDYYAPVVKEWKADGNKITVTFENTSGGLKTLDSSVGVHGFTVAGSDGVYVGASAKIISRDTVEVYNDGVESPVSFTYAFNSYSVTANLCSSYYLPAVPYRSDSAMKNYFDANDWMYCEDTSVWINNGTTGSFEPTWRADTALCADSQLEIDSKIKCEGTGSLKLTYTPQSGVAAAYTAIDYFLMDADMERYGYISVMVRNNDSRRKNLRLVIGTASSDTLWQAAAVNPAGENDEYSAVVQPLTGFTRYTFDLKNLKAYGGESSASDISVSSVLRSANRVGIAVEDTAAGSINIDDFSYGFTKPAEKSYPLYALYGDIDDDKAVTAADALLALQHAVGKRLLDSDKQVTADVNSDGEVTAADALLILQRAVEKIVSFPAEK